MSTRSTIWIKKEDESLKGIYCHFDGYLDGVGTDLFKYYSDADKLNQLIDLGSISNLASEFLIPIGAKHSFEHKMKGMTTFYCRDRGENLEVYQCKNINEIEKFYEEYNYIFDVKNKTWYVSEYGEKLKTLKDALSV